jgi:lysozyme
MIDTSIIKKYEGLRLEAYLCPAGVWTIGYGTTMYPNRAKVKQGESISKSMAERLLDIDVQERIRAMRLPAHLNDNQVSALVSFAYNVGVAAFLGSTLRKKVLLNDKDPAIKDEFLKWKIAGGKVFKGLLNRRHEEAELYFKPIV